MDFIRNNDRAYIIELDANTLNAEGQEPALEHPPRVISQDQVKISTTKWTAMKLIVALCVIVTFIAIAMTIVYSSKASDKRPTNSGAHSSTSSVVSTDVCYSKACTILSGKMLERMDHSVDPCTDFASYACGGYLKENYVPIDDYITGVRETLTDEIYDFFYEQFKFDIGRNDPPYQQKLKTFFESCMNKRENLTSSLRAFVDKELGGLSFSKNLAINELTILLAKMEMYRLHPLFISQPMKIQGDKMLTMSSVRVLDVFFQNITKAKTILEKETKGKAYINNIDIPDFVIDRLKQQIAKDSKSRLIKMKSVLSDLGYENDYNEKDILDVEAMLQELELNELLYTAIPKEYIRTSWEEDDWFHLSEQITNINWKLFLSHILGENYSKLDSLFLTKPIVFAKIGDLIGQKPRIMKNTIMILGLTQLHTYIFPPTTTQEPKPEHYDFMLCIAQMISMPNALNGLFAAKYFDKRTIPVVVQMIEKLRSGFIANIKASSWMSDTSKAIAIAKAEEISTLAAYPKQIEDTEQINALNDEFHPKNTTFVENILKTMAIMKKTMLDWIFDDTNSDSPPTWFNNAYEVNAFYNPLDNSLTILAGIIHSPFFLYAAPQYMLYATLGSVIGHEITHGFDSQSKFFENPPPLTFWPERYEDGQRFKQKGKCFVNQVNKLYLYDEQMDKKYYINGTLTLAENIADAGGLRAAEKAYELWVKEHGVEKSLPGFDKDMTPEKLFYINLAQVRCQKIMPQEFSKYLKDVHTPSTVRTGEIMKNSKKFSEVFKCPLGSPMNPKAKCSIW